MSCSQSAVSVTSCARSATASRSACCTRRGAANAVSDTAL
jgi:hypothetical protein